MNRGGLTLIEVTVALTVTGLALAMGHAGLTTLMDGHERARRVSDETARASSIRRSLADWLEGARAVPEVDGPSLRGIDGSSGQFDDDDLTFLTTSSTPLGTGEFVIHLRVDRDPATPRRGLMVTVTPWPDGESEEVEIDPAVTGLNIRYLGDLEGPRVWEDGWLTTTSLPFAIEVRLGAAADDLPPLLEYPILAVPRGGEVTLAR